MTASARRPLVGITTYALDEVRFGAWALPAALIPQSYVTAIAHAGGRPVLLPPVEGAVDETLDALDGILFSGGDDIEPARYGAEAHPETGGVDRLRDGAELELLHAALERDLPVLAVCRGSQLLNVARGGDLVQHLPEVVGHERHKHTPGAFADHGVRLATESRVGRLLGGRAAVKSHHHQGYGRVGEGLREVAWADDGTVEALEDPGRRFAVAVLWHPEEGEDRRLFEALVAAARAHRAERG